MEWKLAMGIRAELDNLTRVPLGKSNLEGPRWDSLMQHCYSTSLADAGDRRKWKSYLGKDRKKTLLNSRGQPLPDRGTPGHHRNPAEEGMMDSLDVGEREHC
ncbi:Hypothetical predicted protein [Marmota monax]|uniref:Uncharacterized protein n=1 Tax=Marmota monax TaxID=9995 RepID=A0A5E4BF59_MARMO|nr:hypothetical protein GHT09_007027 [Marmota monax]VTJ68005.1 Hypothetical predicted protein [Marmota monax]